MANVAIEAFLAPERCRTKGMPGPPPTRVMAECLVKVRLTRRRQTIAMKRPLIVYIFILLLFFPLTSTIHGASAKLQRVDPVAAGAGVAARAPRSSCGSRPIVS